MMDAKTKAAMAYLDEASPKAEPWTYEDARQWWEQDHAREAKAFNAAMAAIDIHSAGPLEVEFKVQP